MECLAPACLRARSCTVQEHLLPGPTDRAEAHPPRQEPERTLSVQGVRPVSPLASQDCACDVTGPSALPGCTMHQRTSLQWTMDVRAS